jgi:protein-arginine kinase activator protein McsA
MNHNRIILVAAIVILSLSLVMITNGCSKKESEPQSKTPQQTKAMSGQMTKEGVTAQGKAKGATMNNVFTADKLYTCPMHPEVVTDNGEARCPLCGMNLKQMSDEEVTKLRESHPKGCVMDPIVVPGDSQVEKCPICGMNLKEIPQN